MTAHDHPAARSQSQSIGAAAFLIKPFAGKSLVAAVDRLTRSDSPGA
jgi:DNA-binding response OmpR family regulator